MRYKGAFEEKSVGCVLVAGFVISICSLFFGYLFGVAGVFRGTFTRTPITNEITDPGTLNLLPLTLLVLTVGVLMMVGAIGYGLFRSSTKNQGIRKTEQYLRVLARFAYDGSRMITDDFDIQSADRPRFYVRAISREGVVIELETTIEVFYQAGEGMVGEGQIQGRWLGSFVPYIGEPPAV